MEPPLLVMRSRLSRKPMALMALAVSSLAQASLVALPLTLAAYGFLRWTGEPGESVLTKVTAIYALNLAVGFGVFLWRESCVNRKTLVFYDEYLISEVEGVNSYAGTTGSHEVDYREIRHLECHGGVVRIGLDPNLSQKRDLTLAMGTITPDVFDLLLEQMDRIPGHRYSSRHEGRLTASHPWHLEDLGAWASPTQSVTWSEGDGGLLIAETAGHGFVVKSAVEARRAPSGVFYLRNGTRLEHLLRVQPNGVMCREGTQLAEIEHLNGGGWSMIFSSEDVIEIREPGGICLFNEEPVGAWERSLSRLRLDRALPTLPALLISFLARTPLARRVVAP